MQNHEPDGAQASSDPRHKQSKSQEEHNYRDGSHISNHDREGSALTFHLSATEFQSLVPTGGLQENSQKVSTQDVSLMGQSADNLNT